MKEANDRTIYEEIKAQIAAHHDEIIDFGRKLFACPELGFKEVKSNQILTSFFVENGIPCKSDIAVTGIRADLGSGDGYRIALVADMDAIYVRDGEKTYPFHSCGHSIQTSVLAWVMKILKDTGLVEKLGGTVSFIGTPAEEFIDFDYREGLRREGKIKYFSGKQNMIEQGVFDDIDCVISMHINGDSGTLFDIDSTLAGFMVKKAIFKGLAAHSGIIPASGPQCTAWRKPLYECSFLYERPVPEGNRITVASGDQLLFRKRQHYSGGSGSGILYSNQYTGRSDAGGQEV